MILFLDTSALLAASGSAAGASRFICLNAANCGWSLVTSGYCLQETRRNLPKVSPAAAFDWEQFIRPSLIIVADVVSLDQVFVFPKAKDRPVVISALAAKAAALLTLDRTDFHGALGPQVYGMEIRTPADFLKQQRSKGLL